MKYGDFSADSREYVITNPNTPTPWMNYISNMRGYCGIVSQSGGGFSFHKDPRERRITKYRYNNVPVDRPGRYFYIRDNETSEFWSPTWQPVMKKPDSFECRHGQGYTIISSKLNGFEHETQYFVPTDDDCEIWKLTIKNNNAKEKKLSVYSYAEFTFWSEPESRNIQWSLHLTRCQFERGMVLYDFIEPHPAFDMHANKNYVADREGYAFMALSEPVLDYECVRDKFIGMYNSETNPDGVVNGKLTNSILRGGVPCGAMRAEITLKPGEEKVITVVLGFAENADKAESISKNFLAPEKSAAALAKVKQVWTDYISAYNAKTPDNVINSMVNVWNQYQCKTTFDWSRYISFYENGEGRGMGTRDSCQDTLAVNSQLPERVKMRIHQILSTTQFETGDTYHQFFPLGGRGDLKGFSDDHLWMVQMLYAYIAETGEFSILDETAPYASSDKSAGVYEHLKAGLDYTEKMKGPNGLPLILTADWNDTLHLWMECEKPESVVTAALYVYALKLMAQLAAKTNRQSDSEVFSKKAADMSALVNEKCWDGEWYIRGFGSEVIGTHKAKQAKIFLNSQVWCVISGIAQGERRVKCMDSVKKHLASTEGVKKLWPTFTKYDQTYGLISRYVPGRKENGIFSHANSWAIVAETLLNRPDIAFEYYKSVLPYSRNERAEVIKTEPYIWCQTIATEDAHNKGEGANSWLTGTASWMYVAATQYMLGIRPVLEGLYINPQVPSSWNEYTVSRRYRGCLYDIHFKRTGKFSLTLDGKEVKGSILPAVEKKTAKVEVTF